MENRKEPKHIQKILMDIQNKLEVPKNQYNLFGKYNYRSVEDILAALKPLLENLEAYMIISDEVVLVGDRYYIKATARLCSGDEFIENVAYARESLTKKGMDDSQITGSTSSYARKYALNGLFSIDDTKDADTDNNSMQTQMGGQEKKEQKVIDPDIQRIKDKVRECLIKLNWSKEDNEATLVGRDNWTIRDWRLKLTELDDHIRNIKECGLEDIDF